MIVAHDASTNLDEGDETCDVGIASPGYYQQ
jgi:hypothetical protein